ncbi:hypothetical protein AURDEDRAFT_172440 [Auricularia subglabra TFB-10046 SS5]|nr:hypothetical protein AURDEDRAFT_172440 [Auricularia subglabra TFB-10046 SS5]
MQTDARLCAAENLPPELLVDIFLLLPLWERVRAALVCRRWRCVSLEATRQLWATIDLQGDVVVPRDVDACRGLLDRACGTLATFIIHDMHEGNFSELGEMLREHLPHIKSLDITLLPHHSSSWEMTPRVLQGISSTLQLGAPAMERLRIANHSGSQIGGLSILQGHALNSIELHGFDLSCLRHCTGSAALRTLIIATDATRMNLPSLWSLICSFPFLETLGTVVSVADVHHTPAQCYLLPQTLKRLSLALNPDTLSHLTNPGAFARLDWWQLSFPGAVHLPVILPYLQNLTPVSAAVQFGSLKINLMLADAAGRRCIVQAITCNGDWSHPFATVEKLSIGGLGTVPAVVTDTVSAFTSLEDLTFDVTPESKAFTSNTFKWPRLACPSLRTVRLRSASFPRNVPLAAITSLMRDSLAAGPGKLAVLVPDCVHIVAPSGVDVPAALRDLAETVSVLDTGSIWPECHGRAPHTHQGRR